MSATLAALVWLLGAGSSALPTPLPGPPPGLPPATRYTLGNGLRVVMIEGHNLPWLEVRLGFRIGSASDPMGLEGLAAMTGQLLTTGVPGKDEQRIAEELARLGATLGAEVEADTFVLAGEVLTVDGADARAFLELFADVALRPTLPADALERLRQLELAGIKNLVDEPASLCAVAARAAALSGLPEGRASFGTLTSVPRLTRDAIAAWRARALSPAHAVLMIAGSFDHDALLAWVDAQLGGWGRDVTCERAADALPGTCTRLCAAGECVDNPTALPRAARPVAGPPPSPALLITLDDPNVEQVEWRYAAANPVAAMDTRWPAFRLATHLLGGEFTSRLNRVLRTREGLTYGAYLSPDFGAYASGVMAIRTDATPAALAKSVGLGVGMWRELGKAPAPSDELEAIRQTLVNGFPFRFETISHVLDQYSFVELGDMPYSYLAEYRQRLAGVDAAAVRDATAWARAATRPVLVAVGPPSAEKALRAFGPVRVVKALDFLTRGL